MLFFFFHDLHPIDYEINMKIRKQTFVWSWQLQDKTNPFPYNHFLNYSKNIDLHFVSQNLVIRIWAFIVLKMNSFHAYSNTEHYRLKNEWKCISGLWGQWNSDSMICIWTTQ